MFGQAYYHIFTRHSALIWLRHHSLMVSRPQPEKPKILSTKYIFTKKSYVFNGIPFISNISKYHLKILSVESTAFVWPEGKFAFAFFKCLKEYEGVELLVCTHNIHHLNDLCSLYWHTANWTVNLCKMMICYDPSKIVNCWCNFFQLCDAGWLPT